MFKENMTYEELDKMIRELENENDFNFHEVANKLLKSDLKMYLKAYRERFELKESDLSNNMKVPESIYIYSAYLYKQ
nr:hypothetical protein [Lysinibacillus sphaericus]